MATRIIHQHEGADRLDAPSVEKRYVEERARRLLDEGDAQFIDISRSDRFKHFQEDPWVDTATVKDARDMFPDNRCTLLILGAGFGGLVYAVRMVQAGIRPEDIRVVDSAGGWGGTWYWNRYPGLKCDIESYCYLPLLEETDYVPKHRYAYGEEIREYAEFVAEKWGLSGSAVFQTKAQKMVWDGAAKAWRVELIQQRKGRPPQTLNIRSQFVTQANGVLNWPTLPGITGILDYKGDTFHSSRWAYNITGGSPSDPSLSKLKDKRVVVIGTGASSVQIASHLARWSKHLYVVQRTPASVDYRGQKETDEEWFRTEVATSKGWQRERLRNWHEHFTLGNPPDVNLVDDGWTRAPSMTGIAGNPDGPRSAEEVPSYVQKLNGIDLPRMNRIRARVDQEVKDAEVAEKLKPWYPSWCKRPLFDDDYLAAFNRENVTLVDISGKALDYLHLKPDAFVAGEQIYPVDVIIFATGYRNPLTQTPAERGNITILGRDGVSLSEEWGRNGPATLHGILDNKFPNLFFAGVAQAVAAGCVVFNLDQMAKHTAYILSEVQKRASDKPVAVAPTAEASEEWATQVMQRSLATAAVLGCTPSYYNAEGDIARIPPERQTIAARSSTWGGGNEDFFGVLEAWREEGSMRGIEVQT